MEIALLIGKYLLTALIYLFVYVVYRGLIAEARLDREEAAARQARAELPRMTGPVIPRRPDTRRPPAPPTPGPTPAPAPSPPTASPAALGTGPPSLDTVPEIVEEHKGPPALLARELPPEVVLEEPPPVTPAASVLEALAEAESPPPAQERPVTPLPGPEPGTLVVSPTTPRLVVLRSESAELPAGREFPLLAAATLGRAGHNLVVLPDTFVSSQHALIFLKEGRRVLRDRGSTNGTLVNGHRISGDHVLRDGDQITVGTTVLRYAEPPGT